MTNLSGHNDEGEAYLAAIYGGREITANLAAKVAELRASTIFKVLDYELASGQLHACVNDVSPITSYDIPVHEGYWGQPIGYRIRNRGSIAIMLDKAEAMFGWPIYREAAAAPNDPTRTVNGIDIERRIVVARRIDIS